MGAKAVQVHAAHGRERQITWIFIAVLSVALMIVYVSNRNLVNCVNEYVEKSQAIQKVRSEASVKNDKAVDTMVTSFLQPSGDPGQGRIVLETYLETRRQVDLTREKNPVPEPPNHC
jgi:hypothetical protein